jgi:spore coat polysaccharide biosynthesis protein SpsF
MYNISPADSFFISMTNIVAIVQARMGSTRLPGKVLKPLGSKPAIAHVFHQLSGAKHVTHCVLATSDDHRDDALEQWAKRAKVDCVRGNLTDVLDRYYVAAKRFHADAVVRITADCPLLDPTIVDTVVERFLKGDCDYVSNINPPTFPDGLDNEVMTFAALERAWTEAQHPAEREHVTPYIRNHPNVFRLANVENSAENGGDLSAMRWTLDTQQDYDFLNRIMQKLEIKYIKTPQARFTMQNVLTLLNEDKSLLEAVTEARVQNDNYFSALQHDFVARL